MIFFRRYWCFLVILVTVVLRNKCESLENEPELQINKNIMENSVQDLNPPENYPLDSLNKSDFNIVNYDEITIHKNRGKLEENFKKNKGVLKRLEFSADFPSTSNSSENMPRIDQLAKKSRKRKLRRKHHKKAEDAREMEAFLREMANHTELATTKKPRRKKLHRKHKKHNKESRRKLHLQELWTTSKKPDSNILEVTTAKNSKLLTEIRSNSSINDLIQKLNANPEGNFLSFGEGYFNKTELLDISSSGQNSAIKSGRNNSFINLHISVDRNSTRGSRRQNRCSRHRGGCSQICRPRGKRKCACLEGFVLASDMKSCLDIDECIINNGGCEQECKNILGSFECLCKPGLRLARNLKDCEDVDECLLRNGHGPCQGTCLNLFGSYQCSCGVINGTRLSPDKHSCEDINECQEDNNAGCSHDCINTFGSFICSCPPGMELSSDGRTCQDLNECEDKDIRNSCPNGCINTDGSFKCLDLTDYQNDQSYNGLDQVACRPLFPPKFGGFINCSREGAYRSFGRTGRIRIRNSPGTTCQLVCRTGYRIVDQYHVICGFNGEWQGKTSGKCVQASHPVLQCPKDQTYTINEDSETVSIKFPSPKSNISLKFLKSQPKWAKNLNGYLKEGKHMIYFRIKDPQSKLMSSCSFKVNVVKKQ